MMLLKVGGFLRNLLTNKMKKREKYTVKITYFFEKKYYFELKNNSISG